MTLRLALLLSVALLALSSLVAGSATADDVIHHTAERGPVIVQLRIEPAEPVIGDVITLELEVRAEPKVELLMPEFGEALGRFAIIDFAPKEEIDESGATIAHQRYRLQPARSGTQVIPPLRIEFVDRRDGYSPAPEGEDAYELLTERVMLEVSSVLPADAPLVFRPPHDVLAPRRDALGPWWIWPLGIAIALAVAAPFAWRAWQAAQARQRQRSAYEIARTELDSLLYSGRPTPDTMDRFYVALSLVVRTYLENRFALRSPELTTEEFLGEMGRSPDLARSHQQLLSEFLVQADLVKFAGHVPTDSDVGKSIQAAEKFLEDTRDQAEAPTSDTGASGAPQSGSGSPSASQSNLEAPRG